MNKYQVIFVIFLLCFFPSEMLAQEIAEEQAEVIAEPEKETEAQPVIEIKRIKPGQPLYSFELRNAPIKDLLRILAQDYDLNILVDKSVKGEVTASLRNISLEEALERIADMHNFILEKKGNVIIAKPNLITKVFILMHLQAKELLKPVQGLEQEGEEGGGFGINTIYDLLSEDGKILLGKQQNSIVVIDYPANVNKVEEYLQVADRKMTTQVFRLNYLSVKELFPGLVDTEIEERKKRRDERGAERSEIKEMKQQPQAEEGE